MVDRAKKSRKYNYKNLNNLRTKRAFQMKEQLFFMVFKRLPVSIIIIIIIIIMIMIIIK